VWRMTGLRTCEIKGMEFTGCWIRYGKQLQMPIIRICMTADSSLRHSPDSPPTGRGVRTPLDWLVVAIAVLILAPLAALAWVAWAGANTDAFAHLLATVLPRYALTSAALLALVICFVLLLGVGAGWIVAAYDFPGRRLLEIGMILPLSRPAFVLAYAYTDFLDTSGPLQSGLRELTGWSIGQYWFPSVRSLPGAAGSTRRPRTAPAWAFRTAPFTWPWSTCAGTWRAGTRGAGGAPAAPPRRGARAPRALPLALATGAWIATGGPADRVRRALALPRPR
jgi:hypothetical protein